MRLFYYTIAAPALFLLRLIFWPFKLLFRFCRWLHHWRRERRRMRRADFDDMDGWEFEEYVAKLLVRAVFLFCPAMMPDFFLCLRFPYKNPSFYSIIW